MLYNLKTFIVFTLLWSMFSAFECEPEVDFAPLSSKNTFIIIGDPDTQTGRMLWEKLRGEEIKAQPIDSCECKPQMTLWKIDPRVDPVEKKEKAKTAVEQIGNGSNYQYVANVDIELPDSTKNSGFIKSGEANPNNPKGDEIVVAIIDSGIDYGLVDGNYAWNGEIDPDSDRSRRAKGQQCSDVSITSSETPSFLHGSLVVTALIEEYERLQANPPSKVAIPHLRLLDLNIFKDNDTASFFDGLCAMRQAMSKGVDAIVLSWGFYNDGREEYDTAISVFKQFIEDTAGAGIPVIAGAGNGRENQRHEDRGVDINNDRFYPASLSNNNHWNIIAVGATNPELGSLAGYSNYGRGIVPVAASGEVKLQSTSFEGTSYAAPRIALSAAILRYQHRSHSAVKQNFNLLKQGRIDYPPYGFRRLNYTEGEGRPTQ